MRRRDALIAAALTLICVVGTFTGDADDAGVQLAAAVVVTGSLVVRTRWPLVTLACAGVGLAGVEIAGVQPSTGLTLAMLLALFTVGDRLPLRRGVAGAGSFVAFMAAIGAAVDSQDDLWVSVVLVIPAW